MCLNKSKPAKENAGFGCQCYFTIMEPTSILLRTFILNAHLVQK